MGSAPRRQAVSRPPSGPRRNPATARPGRQWTSSFCLRETAAERLKVGHFACSKARHNWPLLRPWSRVRPAVRVLPLSSGPNLSLNRLGGFPLRWSHPCLLQLPATGRLTKPDTVKVSVRSVPAFAKHRWRLRPSCRAVNSHFAGTAAPRTTSRGDRSAAPSPSITWIDPSALRNIGWGARYLPAPIVFSTRKRIPRSKDSSVLPRRSTL